jgi:ABC-type glycerol-3-phosphate transport system substrate-binding protein
VGDGLDSYELVHFNEDGSGLERVKYNLEDTDSTDISATAYKDGYFYLALCTTQNSEALDYALENDLEAGDEIPEGLSEDAASSYQICCVAADGKQKWIKDVKEPKDNMYFYIDSIVPTDEGILVASSEGVDLDSAEDGSFVESKCAVPQEQVTGIIRVLHDGTVIMVDDTGASTKILSFNASNGKFTDSITMPVAMSGASVFAGKQYDVYLASEDGIFGAKLGSDTLTPVVNFVNSDLALEGVSSILELDDGRMAIQAYGAEVVLDTYILQPIKPEDVKDKKELTLAGYYVSYDVRNQVIAFNKESTDYRINIQDYSQYDLAEDDYDSSTGMSKMNTDLVSGNIPDILVMNEYMPVSNYISKGMLEDLTDRYEKDAEIDKSDFMQNVIDAFKTDGRMYMIVPGFTVTGVAGKAKYIGDGSDLTIKKAVDIASKMGLNETGVFGMMDCESVLSYAIEFSGDQFIDMDSHTCDFNNDRFRELLEFAKKFPQQIEEDESVDYSTQYLADKALLGIQFINTPFDYYYMTRQLYGDIDMTVTGFPSENNKGPAVAPSAEIGISSSTSDPDGCWQFVRRFLMEEYQSSLDSCLPISKKAIKAQGQAVIDSFEEQNAELEEELNAQGMEVYNETGSEDAAEAPTGDEITEVTDDVDSSETESEDMTGKPIPEKDFDGTHEEYEKYVKEFKEDMKKAESDTTAEEVIVAPEEIDAGDTAQAYGLDSLPEFGQADLDKMQKILDNLSFSVNSENDVLNIILEEAGAYFAGQKSTEEVSDIIQSRIQVYLKENE